MVLTQGNKQCASLHVHCKEQCQSAQCAAAHLPPFPTHVAHLWRRELNFIAAGEKRDCAYQNEAHPLSPARALHQEIAFCCYVTLCCFASAKEAFREAQNVTRFLPIRFEAAA
jgi:hypothetical protein